MLCGEFYFGPHVNWLFAEESALIHLHTDEREDCPELDILLNVLVRESPGGTSRRQRYRTQSWRYAAGTAVTYPARRAGAAGRPVAPDERCAADAGRSRGAGRAGTALDYREHGGAGVFLSRATFARHFARVYHLTPQAWLSQLRMAMAARLLHLDRRARLEVIAERCGFSITGFVCENL